MIEIHYSLCRYKLQGSWWEKRVLTYKLTNYPNPANSKTRLTNAQVDESLETAMRMWEQVTDIRFQKDWGNNVDIIILFGKGYHGQCTWGNFDGPGGYYAHALYPENGGDIHMDDEEWFTVGPNPGISLLATFVHEIGHSLGLEHSKVEAAIMWPIIKEEH